MLLKSFTRPQNPGACRVCESSQVLSFVSVGDRDYWRCLNCQATFLDAAQLPSLEDERSDYEQHDNRFQDPQYRQFLNRLAEPLLDRLAPQRQGLDYGCGASPVLAEMLRETGHSMAVYDPFFFGDRTPLQRCYDFITCTEVVEHFYHPLQEFKKLDDLLKPGGWLAIMTCFQTRDSAFANWHYRRELTHVTFYRASTFHLLSRQLGFTCEIPCKNVVLMQKKL